MIEPYKIFGRLGNSMFQYAFCYAYAREHGMDFYYQDPTYFEKYADEIKQLYGAGIEPIEMVAVHVRRGDYVNNSFYVDLTNTTYYRDAMALFPGAEFLIFSDDIEWCKKQDIFKDCQFSEGNTELQDLNLMAGCQGIIMANSSFSWWASFLSKAKIIAPIAWYTDGVERTKCLNSWTRI